jgi:glycosyltransferase involved in cell wall biosynthesis
MSDSCPKLRVVMLIWSYWPGHEGGAEKQCRRVVEHLSQEGIEFIILTSLYSRNAAHIEQSVAGTIFRLGRLTPLENYFRSCLSPLVLRIALFFGAKSGSQIITRNILFWLMLPTVWASRISFIIALCSWFKRNGKTISLIHVHESDWLAGVGAWLGEQQGVSVLAKTATENALPTPGYDVPFRGFWMRIRHQCHFLAQHKQHVTELLLGGIPRANISIVPNGVLLPEEIARPGQNGPCLYVGNFSQGAHWKAFDVLIEAWALVCKVCPEASLTMLGGGEVMQWQEFAERQGCIQSIRFQGWTADPSPFYTSSSIFLLPSRVEGLSNALLEAQSYGLPCVVSDIAANLEVVRHEENGLVVPVGNALLFAEAIIRLMNDSQLRARLGIAARNRVSQSYSLAVTSSILKNVYNSKMGGH